MTANQTHATEHPNTNNSLLLVVDVQGKLARMMHDASGMISQQRLLIEACDLLGVPIVWAEQVPDKLGPTVEELAEVLTGQQPITKLSFGCCQNQGLMDAIEAHRPRHILLAGIEAHVCVWQTAAGLLSKGYGVHAIEDAISSRVASNKDIGLGRMVQAGAYRSSVEMALFELMGDAQHPQFRAISGLIKKATA